MSQNEINSKDIFIDCSPVHVKTETNFPTPTNDKKISNDKAINCSPALVKTDTDFPTPINDKKISGFSYKKFILFGIISLIIIGVIIGVVILLKKLSSCKGDYPNKEDNCPCEGDNCPCEGDQCINYKKNDIYIYSETQSKISTIELNDNVPLKTRRLDDFSQKKK